MRRRLLAFIAGAVLLPAVAAGSAAADDPLVQGAGQSAGSQQTAGSSATSTQSSPFEHEHLGSNREHRGRRRGGADERLVGDIGGRQRQQHEPAGRPAGRSAGRGCGEPVSDERPDGQLDGHLDAGSSVEHEHLGPHHEPWRRWLRDADQRLVGQVGRGQQEQHDPVGRTSPAAGSRPRSRTPATSSRRTPPRAPSRTIRATSTSRCGSTATGTTARSSRSTTRRPSRRRATRTRRTRTRSRAPARVSAPVRERLRRRVWRPRRSERPGRRAVRLQRSVGAFVGLVGAGPSEQRQHPGAHRLVGR